MKFMSAKAGRMSMMIKKSMKPLRPYFAILFIALFCATSVCMVRAQDAVHGTGPTQGNAPAGSAEGAAANSAEHAVNGAHGADNAHGANATTGGHAGGEHATGAAHGTEGHKAGGAVG